MRKLICILFGIFLISSVSAISWNTAPVDYVYGEMWYHNHTGTELNFALQNTWYPLFFTEADSLESFSFIGGFGISSNLTAEVAGTYKACFLASGDGQNNHDYFTTVLINGVEQEKCGTHKKMAAGGDIITMNGCCFINLGIGNDIALATMDFSGTGTGNYYSANFNLIRIGD